jgi:hypothetical protein
MSLVQVRSSVLDLLSHARHDRTDESDNPFQRTLPLRPHSSPQGVIDGGGELRVLPHEQQLSLRGRVQVQRPNRNARSVGELLRGDPADAVP